MNKKTFGYSDWQGTVLRDEKLSELLSDGIAKTHGNFLSHLFVREDNTTHIVFQCVRNDLVGAGHISRFDIFGYDDFVEFVNLVNETKKKLDESRK